MDVDAITLVLQDISWQGAYLIPMFSNMLTRPSVAKILVKLLRNYFNLF
jgi:hypothetical protein